MKGSSLCFWHDPSKADDVAEAQRLGGIRRRRERTIASAYDFTGLGTVESIRRVLEIATTDALGLDNGVPRIRTLIAAAQAATKLLETGELEQRLAALESVIAASRASAGSSGDPLAG